MGMKTPLVVIDKPKRAWDSFGPNIAVDLKGPAETRPYFLARVIVHIQHSDTFWIFITTLVASVAAIVLAVPYTGFFVADLIGYAVAIITSIAYTRFTRERADRIACQYTTPEERKSVFQYYLTKQKEAITWRNDPNAYLFSKIFRRICFDDNGEFWLSISEPSLAGRIYRLSK